MDSAPTTPPAEPDDENALDSTNDDVDALDKPDDSSSGVIDATASASGTNKAAPDQAPKSKGIKQKLQRFNIYLLLFLLILVIAGGVVIVAYFQSKKATSTSALETQNLTQSTLNQVASSDATVGNSGQVLNVESSAVFAGKVLIRDDLEVAGSLEIGGTVALTDLAVSGTSSLGQVAVSKDLSVTGDTAIQGAATIAKSLQVNGSGTFNGGVSAPQITTSSLQLNADLVLTHHIVAGGPSPGKSNGPALGGGGTATVSGSDTSGAISINTGSSPGAGCFISVNFASKYNSTPHILITPVGSAAGALDYYVDRTTTSFSICDASAPPAGSSFGFDYFVID